MPQPHPLPTRKEKEREGRKGDGERVRAAPSFISHANRGEREREANVAFIGGGERGEEEREEQARRRGRRRAGMGDSGGSVVSIDVERISFGGKVRPHPPRALPVSRACFPRAALLPRRDWVSRIGFWSGG